MAIVLRELKTAVENYLNTKVTVSINGPSPSAGTEINANEPFTIDFVVTNSLTSLAEAIRLKNVRYAVDCENPTVAKLIVPTPNIAVARSGHLATDPTLTAGTQVNGMVLFPTGERNVLEPGESDTLHLHGMTGSGSPLATTKFRFRVIAEPDLDFLFPKNEDSVVAFKQLTIQPT